MVAMSAARKVSRAFVERVAVPVALVVAMAGCAAPADSALRKELDQLYAAQAWHFPIDNAVLKFIPIGTPEKQAVDTLSKAGLGQKRRDKDSIADPRCPWQDPNPAAPRMPCPNPANKSDYYLTFEAGAGDWGYFWTTFYVQIGVRGGLVDFVVGQIRRECLFCP